MSSVLQTSDRLKLGWFLLGSAASSRCSITFLGLNERPRLFHALAEHFAERRGRQHVHDLVNRPQRDTSPAGKKPFSLLDVNNVNDVR